MSRDNVRHTRQPHAQSVELMLLVGCAGLVVAAGLAVAVALKLQAHMIGVGTPAGEVPWNPVKVLVGLVKGRYEWSGFATVVMLLIVVVVSLIGMLVGVASARRRGRRKRVDAVRPHLASVRDISSMSKRQAQLRAEEWLPKEVAARHPGLRVGHNPGNKRQGLYSTWEDLLLVVMGPRMGKSTAVVIPAIVDAPGPVLTTSNKRDIVDETVGVTAQRGKVWVFDPQRIAVGVGQEEWFFDPLEMVRRDEAVMDSAAMELADIFKCAARGDSDGGDAFFSDGGRDLLARLFLAAALDGRGIGDVFVWVNDERDRTAVGILSQYDQWRQQAEALSATYNITEKTRSGLFSQAAQMAAPLGRRAALEWVTPRPGARAFSPDEFVRSEADALYVLSKEGADNAAALTTALTAAVMKAAEQYGEQSGGRLPVPLVAALDEAANVVRWPQLPQLYSHYGSRSIILITVLQSYSQGEKVWGASGMEALWSAASLLLFGGGIRDDKMLSKVESLVGEYEQMTTSVSRSRQGRSVSTQVREKKILTMSELAALEQWRGLLFAAKRRPMVVELEPWWVRSWPREVTAQLRGKSAGVVDEGQEVVR